MTPGSLSRSPTLTTRTATSSYRGHVDSIEDDEGNKFIDSMAKKYIDQDTYPWHQPGDHRVVVKVHPEHTSKM